MRTALYGEGSAIAVIAPFVAFLLGFLNLTYTIFLALLLFGIWTVVCAFLFANGGQRFYYLAWGLIVASISTFFVSLPNYAIALILVVVIALIVYSAIQRNSNNKAKVPKPAASV